MLLYSLLHLSGYALSLEGLQNFRQLHSKPPGHSELGYTAGVEATTGPLGQGLANAVGMAITECTLAGQFNRPDRSPHLVFPRRRLPDGGHFSRGGVIGWHPGLGQASGFL